MVPYVIHVKRLHTQCMREYRWEFVVWLQLSILHPKKPQNWENLVISSLFKWHKFTSYPSHSAIYCVYWSKIANLSWNFIKYNNSFFKDFDFDSSYPHVPMWNVDWMKKITEWARRCQIFVFSTKSGQNHPDP